MDKVSLVSFVKKRESKGQKKHSMFLGGMKSVCRYRALGIEVKRGLYNGVVMSSGLYEQKCSEA